MVLCISVCKGERPRIIENTPQCYVDLMKRCWDKDPLNRPSALDVKNVIKKWIYPSDDVSEELDNTMEFIKASNNPTIPKTINIKPHLEVYYTSRLLNLAKD